MGVPFPQEFRGSCVCCSIPGEDEGHIDSGNACQEGGRSDILLDRLETLVPELLHPVLVPVDNDDPSTLGSDLLEYVVPGPAETKDGIGDPAGWLSLRRVRH